MAPSRSAAGSPSHVMRVIAAAMAAVLAAACMASCADGPDYTRPAPPQADRPTVQPLPDRTAAVPVLAGDAQVFVTGAAVPTQWWKQFGSDSLDALVEEAFRASPTVQSAQAALRQAHENVLAAYAALIPAIDATGSGQRQRISGAQFGPNSPSFVYNLYNAAVNVSYGIDIWGGARRELESLKAQQDSQQYALQATYLTLASNVVTTAIAEASLREQIATTEQLVGASGHRLDVIKRQQQLGGASSAEVLAQQTEVAQDRAGLPGLRDQLDRQRSLLATLLGRAPGNQPTVEFHLADLKLPTELPVALPSALVQQRPDVRQQEELLHSASAQVGVATSNMLPQLSLTASYGGSSTSANTLLNSINRTWSVGGSISQPIFHGGRLLHQRRAAIAAYDQALADYRQTVLTAFRNVSDSLRALADDADTLTEQNDAEQAASASLSLTDRQYSLGAVSFLTLLNAQRTEAQAHLLLIQAQAARYADTAALYQALGGDWANQGTTTTARAQESAASPTQQGDPR